MMIFQTTDLEEDRLEFADEDDVFVKEDLNPPDHPWKIMIVDDEEDVHAITRITLRGYRFENRGIELLSAYCEADVKSVMAAHPDIALILLDVVMEKDDTGLQLVEYIRKELGNSSVRIVLRTGQPGKAPEQEVITRYDINDYKTKPEFTAQKLFTTVTACLRAYHNLKVIEKNNEGLETIIRSSAEVFKHQSVSLFGKHVLRQLFEILKINPESDIDCAYGMGMPDSSVMLMSGTGRFRNRIGQPLEEIMPPSVIRIFRQFEPTGGESFSEDHYVGVFNTDEGFSSILYMNGCGRLSAVDKKLVRIYANNIAIGFDNASLAREIINTQKEVILTLGEVVETRSKETAHHVTRVAEVCYLLAEKFGLPEKNCELLRMAAPMHDVGKIGVPEAILNKPGKLTPDEFEIMKKHARTGYDILKNSKRSIMQAAAIVALQHHERWDGAGYPQGLAGEGIHIFGRIAAIADVFDALSHGRCYKQAWEMSRVVDFFEKSSGTHFDSRLIQLLLIYISEFEAINRRFPE